MNKTKIEWTNYSWNPIVGCKHGCWYCYAKKLTERFKKIFPNGFEPTYHSERLHEPYELKKPSKIFVCSIADLFAPWTNEGWTNCVLVSMLECPIKHTFQMLTKNPERIMNNWIISNICSHDGFNHAHVVDKAIPDNWWFGTTVTGENGDVKNIGAIKQVPAKVRFVSFEPLLSNIDFSGENTLEGIQWIIIGKLTGSRRVKLQKEWVDNILRQAFDLGIPVFIKNNLAKEKGLTILRQEFPYD